MTLVLGWVSSGHAAAYGLISLPGYPKAAKESGGLPYCLAVTIQYLDPSLDAYEFSCNASCSTQ